MEIRDATAEDAAQICAIWNPIIRDTLITFTTQQKTTRSIKTAIHSAQTDNRPYLVAQQGEQILGFATYSPFRAGPGYAKTMEHSVNLAPVARGKGVGRALVQSLEAAAKKGEIHSLIAGVSGANPAAIAFHTALGFTKIATIPDAGFKFDQWLDLVLLQKLL